MYKFNDEVELKIVPAEDIVDIECEDVTIEEFPEIKKLGEAMIELCVSKSGVGLAAPQVGVKKNMFVWMNGVNSFQIVLNPKIFPGKKKTNLVEGCLSYPKERYFLQRSKETRMKFNFVKDGEMKSHSANFHGEKSFVLQHEYDHLIGNTIATKGQFFSKDEEILDEETPDENNS